MIADQMRRLFAYNTWAWQHVYVSVEKLDAAAYHAPRDSFHDSIHGLLVHSMFAEEIWFARTQGENPTEILTPAELSSFADVRARWSPVRHSWANYLQWLSDDACKTFVDYRDTKGRPYSARMTDILQHVINHATEHRSQITPILSAQGAPTEMLDYIYYRTRP